MHNHLFFICPTDYLETIVNAVYQSDNYFITSLGNSIVFNSFIINELNEMIESKSITEITFLLADDNEIVIDALQKQEFAKMYGLNDLYVEIANQTKQSKMIWMTNSHSIHNLSYHLNLKVKELRLKLNNWLVDSIKIHTKIYRRKKEVYGEFHSDLYHLELASLN